MKLYENLNLHTLRYYHNLETGLCLQKLYARFEGQKFV